MVSSDIANILIEIRKFAIADLHLHGRYAISCSRTAGPKELIEMAVKKGIYILGTGDCLHKEWWNEWQQYLYTKELTIVPTTEVSLHFVRKRNHAIHFIVVFSNPEAVQKAEHMLCKYGNLEKIARPDIYMKPNNFCDVIHQADNGACIIGAHIFTPYFSVLGRRGVEDISELGVDICAVETGISSDPLMCATVETLSGIPLVSFSDAHSPRMLGREATVIDPNLPIAEALKNPIFTIECFPEFGKYHRSGHKDCGHSNTGDCADTLCPKCGKTMTLGVHERLLSLKKIEGQLVKPFVRVMPLEQILSASLGFGANSKRVQSLVDESFKKIGPELHVLLLAKPDELALMFDDKTIGLILAIREDKVKVKPGYDGVYGEIEHSL
jgi:uncharacterized protein (TIGR00375 family)